MPAGRMNERCAERRDRMAAATTAEQTKEVDGLVSGELSLLCLWGKSRDAGWAVLASRHLLLHDMRSERILKDLWTRLISMRWVPQSGADLPAAAGPLTGQHLRGQTYGSSFPGQEVKLERERWASKHGGTGSGERW